MGQNRQTMSEFVPKNKLLPKIELTLPHNFLPKYLFSMFVTKTIGVTGSICKLKSITNLIYLMRHSVSLKFL